MDVDRLDELGPKLAKSQVGLVPKGKRDLRIRSRSELLRLLQQGGRLRCHYLLMFGTKLSSTLWPKQDASF